MISVAVMFVASMAQAWLLTICALALGRKLRILDFPDKQRKLHARATPRTGGLAVCGALLLGVAESVLFQLTGPGADGGAFRFTLCLALSTLLLCGLGLWDDKFGMRARVKFLWQALAVLPFVLWGRSTLSADLFGWHLDFAWLAAPLILFWLVACTNFVNLVDGLDGLAGSVGLIVSASVAVMAWWNQLFEIGLLAAMLSGALVGFLRFNWPPARIFLGDSGSLPLGFLVGALALEASAKKAAGLTLAVPIVLLSIPIFDTSMAILRRKLNGRRIGQGDRAHIHHILQDRGFSPRATLLWISGMCLATASAGVAATIFNSDWFALGLCAVLLATLVAGRVFGFNETVLLARHLGALRDFLAAAPRALRAKFVIVRLEDALAAGQLELWHKIVKRAMRLSALSIEFECEHIASGRNLGSLTWTTPDSSADDSPEWQLQYRAPRGAGIEARVEARGLVRGPSRLNALHELSELLAALCESWPVAGLPAAPAEPAQQGANILPGNWPAPTGAAPEPVARVTHDAA